MLKKLKFMNLICLWTWTTQKKKIFLLAVMMWMGLKGDYRDVSLAEYFLDFVWTWWQIIILHVRVLKGVGMEIFYWPPFILSGGLERTALSHGRFAYFLEKLSFIESLRSLYSNKIPQFYPITASIQVVMDWKKYCNFVINFILL